MIQLEERKVMVLAPHTDDGEMGCGGAIAKMIGRGAEVFYTAFSACEQSVPYGFREKELEFELREATQVLGIQPDHLFIHPFPVRHFTLHRQDILQSILDAKNEIGPDLVFMPCVNDIHQDHQVVAMEGLRAYKGNTILSYEMPWNNLTIETSAFIVLEERHLEKKLAALACYKSQAFRHYANPEFLRALAITRGAQIGVRYAEVFQLVRLVS